MNFRMFDVVAYKDGDRFRPALVVSEPYKVAIPPKKGATEPQPQEFETVLDLAFFASGTASAADSRQGVKPAVDPKNCKRGEFITRAEYIQLIGDVGQGKAAKA